LLAGLFVSMTLAVFLLLTLKYAEVSVRFPQGGGVVTVAAHAFNPWVGDVGGMFILVDYFLTAAISADSGLRYLSAVFHSIAPVVLLLSVVVIALLGVLNWWGIKDSAEVSAVAAMVAFVTDIAILVALPLNVPLHALGQAFTLMFSTPLKPLTLLTGFAGSFLAFSGLESISQLSPVMRMPRGRTVKLALGFVVITVGITSPLLTIFSTTLLTACTPHFTTCSVQVWHAALAGHHPLPDPNQFISELAAVAGGTSFGRFLEIVTAIAASALLVFASNTAIIGAYHVCVALARMGFLPRVIQRRSKWRGTPSVAIALVTAIPIFVLLLVNGDVNTLGDMYAFGLLGAFSLTSLSLDVIRWRERHGHPPIKDDADHEADRERDSAAESREMASARARGSPSARSRLWAHVNFYLGIVTTILVSIAWLTNLKNKPLATEFGGTITVLGVAISVIHYRYQHRKGRRPIFPTILVRRIPNCLLVVLSPDTRHHQQLVAAACELARGRPIVFLYIAKAWTENIRLLQFADPYLYDEHAQRVFSEAAHLCYRKGVRPIYFVYSVGGPEVVSRALRVIQPDIVLMEATEDQPMSLADWPEAMIVEIEDGVRVAQYVLSPQANRDASA
jgi:amino acid transporter